METFWFCAISLLLTLYVVLDIFDLGAGVVYFIGTRTARERRSVLAAIGPFWDGNEIWLLTAALVLYCAFPAAYSGGFSGYYLTLTFVLWLLLIRGIGAEVLHRMPDDGSVSPRRSLEVVFGVTSLTVPMLFGVTLGNLIRGVPLTQSLRVFDWFTLLWGAAAVSLATLTGALWLASKTEGDFQTRCRVLASRLWWLTLIACSGAAFASLPVQPHFLDSISNVGLGQNPWMAVFAITALAGLLGVRLCQSVGFDLGAFGSTLALTAGLFGALATAQFPYLLGPTTIFNATSFNATSFNATAGAHHLSMSMLCWIPGFVLAFGYNLVARRRSAVDLPGQAEKEFSREVVAVAHSVAAR